MAMQAGAVDVFILRESNYTNSGSVKELKFLQKFQQGWLRQYYHKCVYIFQSTFPEEGVIDGKIADAFRYTLFESST